jgi:DNA invertase Pin-like site-specific DNA recombinase
MDTTEVRYCLYARKSSEQDERQAMSVESQVKEMLATAEKDSLNIVETLRESHSAKESGQRPVFNELLMKIRENHFDGILTWAPDRLSRNAGDLGSLVDLMDQGKLQRIKTYGQSFSNTPNEKFLLMILCSQAKLENDNKSINVKRGIRAKCEMGIRPGPVPLGYINHSLNGLKTIMVDKTRAVTVKEMFQRSAKGQSGRHVKRWLDGSGFRTRRDKCLTLSQIYAMLKNPFYYGEFRFGEDIYKGAHEPLISKELFDKVQKRFVVPEKAKWGSKEFPFRRFLKCAGCGAAVVGEEKIKHCGDGSVRRHVYYHCSRQVDYDCDEPYVREDRIVEGLLDQASNFRLDTSMAEKGLIKAVNDFGAIAQVLEVELKESDLFYRYVQYVLKGGSEADMARLVHNLRLDLVVSNRKVLLAH